MWTRRSVSAADVSYERSARCSPAASVAPYYFLSIPCKFYKEKRERRGTKRPTIHIISVSVILCVLLPHLIFFFFFFVSSWQWFTSLILTVNCILSFVHSILYYVCLFVFIFYSPDTSRTASSSLPITSQPPPPLLPWTSGTAWDG